MQVQAVHGVCRTQILHLTSSCRSTFAPAESRSCIASVWPLLLAHMRAVLPYWGTQWEQNSDNTCWWIWTRQQLKCTLLVRYSMAGNFTRLNFAKHTGSSHGTIVVGGAYMPAVVCMSVPSQPATSPSLQSWTTDLSTVGSPSIKYYLNIMVRKFSCTYKLGVPATFSIPTQETGSHLNLTLHCVFGITMPYQYIYYGTITSLHLKCT